MCGYAKNSLPQDVEEAKNVYELQGNLEKFVEEKFTEGY